MRLHGTAASAWDSAYVATFNTLLRASVPDTWTTSPEKHPLLAILQQMVSAGTRKAAGLREASIKR